MRAKLSDILKHLKQKTVKGELTIIVHGASKEPLKKNIDTTEYLKNLMLHRGLTKKEAIAAAAEELGLPKKEVYKESLKI